MKKLTGLMIYVLLMVILAVPDVFAGKKEESRGKLAEAKKKSANTVKQTAEAEIPLDRLALAEKEVTDANSAYTLCVNKTAMLRRLVVVLQGQYEALEENAKGLEKQLERAKDTKDRAEGQYKPTKRDAGIRKRLSKKERDEAIRAYRGLIAKAADTKAEMDKKKIIWDFTKNELCEAEKELAKAQAVLQAKKETLKTIIKCKKRNNK